MIHDEAKVGGILVELSGDALGPSLAIVGVGLNVRLPASIRRGIGQPVTDLATIGGRPALDRNTLLARIVAAHCRRCSKATRTPGLPPCAPRGSAATRYQKKPVQVVLPDGGTVRGVVVGVDATGALVLDSAGRRLRFVSGEVSLRRAVILVLDCGNSRLKWGLAGPHGWVSQGNVANQEIGTLALRDWQNLPRPARVVGVNVAGEATRVRVEAQLVRWRTAPEWLIAHEEAGGVYNRYARPSQLGPDRWAALIAARRRVADELFPSPCVVVNAGTAVTVDALDGNGVFRGGIILPGLD